MRSRRLANLATKAGVEGRALRVHAPLIRLSKADIVREGMRLGVDFAATVSCYTADADGRACGLAMRAACARKDSPPRASPIRRATADLRCPRDGANLGRTLLQYAPSINRRTGASRCRNT